MWLVAFHFFSLILTLTDADHSYITFLPFHHHRYPTGDSPPPPPASFVQSLSSSDSIPRKRTISRTDMDNLPPIPPIEGELMLEVYTHDSLNARSGTITNDENGGSVRLATLGQKVLESAVMTNLFRRRPMHSATQLEVSHLSVVFVVPDPSKVWRVGNGERLCQQEQCRSMGHCLRPEEQSPVCSGTP